MSSYRKLYPYLEKGNAYISTIVFDERSEDTLYNGVSLIEMTSPIATLKNPGKKMSDFLYSLCGKPIVSNKAKLFLEDTNESGNYEFIKVQFKNKKKKESYYLLNVLNQVDAFDWETSEYTLFDEPGPKGNKVIDNLIKMNIDESKTDGRQLFNLVGFEGHHIIHTDLVDQMIADGITGILTDPLQGHQ
jgi:hypothetical protein